MNHKIQAICTGQASPFRGEEKSAINKQPVSGPVRINTLGIHGDVQVDKRYHGGPHMAVHLYPLDHHAFWRDEIGQHPLLEQPGAFGSNLSVAGITEGDLAIGDRFRLGSALLEVSQPRQPCWKIEHRFGQKGMVATILKTGRCGWYFRVIEEGMAKAGDALELVERSDSGWSVERACAAFWGAPKSTTRQEWEELAALETLTPKLRDKAKATAEG